MLLSGKKSLIITGLLCIFILVVVSSGLYFRLQTATFTNPAASYRGLSINYGYSVLPELNNSMYTGVVVAIENSSNNQAKITIRSAPQNLIKPPLNKETFSFNLSTTPATFVLDPNGLETIWRLITPQVLDSIPPKSVVSVQFIFQDSPPTGLDQVLSNENNISKSLILYSYLHQ